MLVDLDNLFWMDYGNDGEDSQHLLIMGFSIIAEIRETKDVIEHEGCGSPELLNTELKYTAIFNGYGNTQDELKVIYDSGFEEIPVPELFPIIGQSNDLDKLKEKVIKYIERQFNASKPTSKSELTKKMKREEEVLSALVNKYMNMFTIKNELN